ncbi:MAG TPA: glycine cleavage T C-terminal barrel domain-containing protein, partial [Anaerolineae bacterium]|nr:glycine cleavage T C-terminal barrel domain-containing protein [Anaerolineae bacterium]
TADVEGLKTGQGARSALLDAKGHFVADFVLLRDGDALGALVEPSARESLFNALRAYVIREQVKLTDVTDLWQCLTLVGAQAGNVIERVLEARPPDALYNWVWGRVVVTAARVVRVARARVPAYDILIPVSGMADLRAAVEDIPQLPADVMETLRIEAGLPRWGVDFDESTLALEIPDVMQIRVDQGCYVGQEVVARIVHRGHVNRELRGLRIEGDALPTRGEAIRFDGIEVGAVTSSAHSPMLGNISLGYVRRHVEPGSQVQLLKTPARVVELPFPLV